ncbi:hypothetical protein GWI33_009718 [Rhynchophorus ferrugineus]|uniref:Uncharacterized protein n=1 Tax=Rhynchophorus ferrugineus TaxID=354439 RepID=A0A834IMQ8_RHYFE|nr:hypothetical protein GWI33_009718 [Rhynchophorus ferrugineus]
MKKVELKLVEDKIVSILDRDWHISVSFFMLLQDYNVISAFISGVTIWLRSSTHSAGGTIAEEPFSFDHSCSARTYAALSRPVTRIFLTSLMGNELNDTDLVDSDRSCGDRSSSAA